MHVAPLMKVLCSFMRASARHSYVPAPGTLIMACASAKRSSDHFISSLLCYGHMRMMSAAYNSSEFAMPAVISN